MRLQCALEHLGGDLGAVCQHDDVVEPAVHVEEAVLVHAPHVTRVQPAVSDALRGEVGYAQIPRHDVLASHEHLAVLARAHLVAAQGHAAAAVFVPAVAVDADAGGALGEAVAAERLDAVRPQPPRHACGQPGSAAEHLRERGQAIGPPVEQVGQHRGGPRRHVEGGGRQARQLGRKREGRSWACDGAARDQGSEQVAHQAERMRVGEELRIACPMGKLVELQPRGEVGQQAPLGEHGDLGVAGRARARDERADILGHGVGGAFENPPLGLGQRGQHRAAPRGHDGQVAHGKRHRVALAHIHEPPDPRAVQRLPFAGGIVGQRAIRHALTVGPLEGRIAPETRHGLKRLAEVGGVRRVAQRVWPPDCLGGLVRRPMYGGCIQHGPAPPRYVHFSKPPRCDMSRGLCCGPPRLGREGPGCPAGPIYI